MNKIITIAIILLAAVRLAGGEIRTGNDSILVLCYHDIPLYVNRDDYAVDRDTFVQQIEYLRTHGYHFVSVEDVVRANQGEKNLPERPVLLTFDDGYASFYEFVAPLLKLYGYPSVLAVVTGWLENGPPPDVKQRLMTWEQLGEVARGGLVEIASHTHDQHRTVRYNPQGGDGWALTSRTYDRVARTYETDEECGQRFFQDFTRSEELLRSKLGVDARVIVWPYGKFNRLCIEEAKRTGFGVMFSLDDKFASARDLDDIPRYVLCKNPPMKEFIKVLKDGLGEPVQQRIVQADLDLIYDPDPARQEKNLDAFIDRIVGLKASTVYLQAFCDDKANGNIESVYFPNRVLPMKTDLFNRVVNSLAIRGIQVYAWMPMLSIVLPDGEENERLRVREFSENGDRPSTSWYRRLSPFCPEAVQKLEMLYADMAANARIDGVVFQDDGYLNDFEDFNPAARMEYLKISGGEMVPFSELDEERKRRWTRVKTARLIELTGRLKEAVRRYRPQALFSRTFYAPVLTEPESEEWFAQNYADGLKAYDFVVVMAYPSMEEIASPLEWLKTLVREAQKYPGGLSKTVFKVQAYDWKKDQWIDAGTIDRWLRALAAAGAQHLAYYPDDYTDNKPDKDVIKGMMCTEDFPFLRR